MNLIWLDAFLITGLFSVAMIIGLGALLHLQMGLTRIANFGVVGFWGLGMYVYGVMYVQIDWPFGDPWQFLISAIAATVAAGLAGLLVGWMVADLDDDAVLLGTFGFATIVYILATTEVELTGGALGLGGLRFPYKLDTAKANEALWLIILIILVAFIILYVIRVHRSPYGRLLIAVGDNEPLARSLGKATFRTKLWLFTVGSAGMGMLGVMFAVLERFLVTTNLGVELTLAAVVGLVLGGTTRVWGPLVGVALTVGLFDIVVQSYLPLPKSWYGGALPVLREMLFGATLIGVLLFRPLGILGDMRRDKLMRSMHGE